MSIDIEKELDERNRRLPAVFEAQQMPLEIQIRSIALTIAQRHAGDTVVSEGNLYQQLKMDNKLGGPLTVDHVVTAALVFERYLWGEWSKGLAENAISQTSAELADVLEKQFEDAMTRGATKQEKLDEESKDEPPTRPSAGGESPS